MRCTSNLGVGRSRLKVSTRGLDHSTSSRGTRGGRIRWWWWRRRWRVLSRRVLGWPSGRGAQRYSAFHGHGCYLGSEKEISEEQETYREKLDPVPKWADVVPPPNSSPETQKCQQTHAPNRDDSTTSPQHIDQHRGQSWRGHSSGMLLRFQSGR